MKDLIQLAYNIWTDYLDKTTDTDPGRIASWIMSNVGEFNILTNSSLSVSNNDFSPEIGAEEAAIFGYMYLVKYNEMMYRKAVRGLLVLDSNTGTISTWTELRDADSSIKRASPNDTAKIFLTAKSNAESKLSDLVFKYNIYNSSPRQVEGIE